MMPPAWKCIPYAKVMTQMLEPGSDREEVVDVRDEALQKVKSAKADMLSQIPNRNLVECSIDIIYLREVSKRAKASTVLKKYQIAMQKECPISVGKVLYKFVLYLVELKQCPNCPVDETDDSALFRDKTRNAVSMYHLVADSMSSRKGLEQFLLQKVFEVSAVKPASLVMSTGVPLIP